MRQASERASSRAASSHPPSPNCRTRPTSTGSTWSTSARAPTSRSRTSAASTSRVTRTSASRAGSRCSHSKRRHLASDATLSGKKVNLVSFTPGTSFEMGWQTGSQQERQLLHIILNGMEGADADVRAGIGVVLPRRSRLGRSLSGWHRGDEGDARSRARSSDPARVHDRDPSQRSTRAVRPHPRSTARA